MVQSTTCQSTFSSGLTSRLLSGQSQSSTQAPLIVSHCSPHVCQKCGHLCSGPNSILDSIDNEKVVELPPSSSADPAVSHL